MQSYVMRQKILALNISIDNITDDGAYILMWQEATYAVKYLIKHIFNNTLD